MFHSDANAYVAGEKRMKATLATQLGQQLHLTPALLQSIRLLQLNGLQLEQEIRQALENNPLLELEEHVADAEPLPGNDAQRWKRPPSTSCRKAR